jgi:anthranilate phosphoribosyltransferase
MPSAELQIIMAGQTLTEEQSATLMTSLLHGELGDAGIEALLTALHQRDGSTAAELAGFNRGLQQASTPLPLTDVERDALVDTCGTGGDGSSTFNISTAVALVAAAAGVPVAKHGNRKVTSQCGSADILERLGVSIGHTPQQAAEALRRHKFAFLLAPSMHPAMRLAAPVRQRLPFRTVFNLLGPMSNPAGARRQVLGVYSRRAVTQVAEALAVRGSMLHAMIVHGTGSAGNGLDELSLAGETIVAEVKGAAVRYLTLCPEDAGLSRSDAAIPGGSVEVNEAILRAVFAGEKGIARDIVLLNAAAVFLVADRVASLHEGAHLAVETIDSGTVEALLSRLSGSTV